MKNGKDSTHKKRAFRKRLKKSRHKKEHVGFLWNPTGKKRASFKAIEPMDTPHPEDNGDAVGGFAKQSA